MRKEGDVVSKEQNPAEWSAQSVGPKLIYSRIDLDSIQHNAAASKLKLRGVGGWSIARHWLACDWEDGRLTNALVQVVCDDDSPGKIVDMR